MKILRGAWRGAFVKYRHAFVSGRNDESFGAEGVDFSISSLSLSIFHHSITPPCGPAAKTVGRGGEKPVGRTNDESFRRPTLRTDSKTGPVAATLKPSQRACPLTTRWTDGGAPKGFESVPKVGTGFALPPAGLLTGLWLLAGER
jgi:hypothetical protein